LFIHNHWLLHINLELDFYDRWNIRVCERVVIISNDLVLFEKLGERKVFERCSLGSIDTSSEEWALRAQ